jgi:hypothetical protein
MSVRTAETASEPKHPMRFEKKTNNRCPQEDDRREIERGGRLC